MLPLNSIIKDAFDKFDQDFQAANLPEVKYITAPPSTAKWYKVGQPCYEDKMQELNTDFAKICISPKPSGAPMGKVPLPILKELEHQARLTISTLNFTTTFAKTSSSCNSTLEKCQHSLKSTFKKKVAKGSKAWIRGSLWIPGSLEQDTHYPAQGLDLSQQIPCSYTPEGVIFHGQHRLA